MKNSIIIILLTILSLILLTEARRSPLPRPDRLSRYPYYPRHHPFILQDTGTSCTICITTLTLIKTQLPEIEQITKTEIQYLLRQVCDHYASLFDDICISIEEKIVIFVLDMIVKYGEKIDPLRNCEFLHICARDPTTTTTTTTVAPTTTTTTVAPTTTVTQTTTMTPTTNTEGPTTIDTAEVTTGTPAGETTSV